MIRRNPSRRAQPNLSRLQRKSVSRRAETQKRSHNPPKHRNTLISSPTVLLPRKQVSTSLEKPLEHEPENLNPFFGWIGYLKEKFILCLVLAMTCGNRKDGE